MPMAFEQEFGVRQLVEELLGAGHFSWDLNSGSVRWSRGLFALLGLDAAGAEPRIEQLERAIYPDDRHLFVGMEQLLLRSIAVEREFRIVGAGGRLRWIMLKCEPLVGPDRTLRWAVGVCWDVTRHREDVLLLQQNQLRLQSIANLANVLCWVAKPDGNLVDFLNASERGHFAGLGTSPDWTRLVHPEDVETFQEAWRRGIERRTRLSIEFRMLGTDGASFVCWLLGAPSLDSSGAIIEWNGILRRLDDPDELLVADRGFLSGAQLRGARGILSWSVERLAQESGVRPGTIRRLEEFDGQSPNDRPELQRLEQVLSNSGIEFVFARDGKPGLRPR
ncbi:PAS domain-containing protein [Bradyrhizobium manausense]|uniref:PAS domain-containing protein n=1 Tax=Bradyrhizobium manausense TaxID=989370 RepID=UPI001BA5CF69|nr:PAS domain-containing protein [Bradyrhizobium manausense]MBR1087505.1 PAS domain-containing protein [Bradyrhizobium manausense]